MATTLKTLVLKTATVTSVKLGAPADRIGLGRDVASVPAGVLSPRPSNSGGPRQVDSAMRMHQEPAAATEPRLAGRYRPGSSASRWPDSFSRKRDSKRAGSPGSFPAISSSSVRIGDCQLPDRRDGQRIATTGEAPRSAAAAQ